jgi:hypothetical protein
MCRCSVTLHIYLASRVSARLQLVVAVFRSNQGRRDLGIWVMLGMGVSRGFSWFAARTILSHGSADTHNRLPGAATLSGLAGMFPRRSRQSILSSTDRSPKPGGPVGSPAQRVVGGAVVARPRNQIFNCRLTNGRQPPPTSVADSTRLVHRFARRRTTRSAVYIPDLKHGLIASFNQPQATSCGLCGVSLQLDRVLPGKPCYALQTNLSRNVIRGCDNGF